MTAASTQSHREDCPSVPRASDLYLRTLHRACEKIGGIGPLARHLGVSAITLTRWLEGTVPVPQTAFLKAVDLLLA